MTVPLNPAFTGRTYEAAAYLVGREKIREFATAVGERSPLSHEVAAAQAAGYRDLVAPVTFAIIVHFAAMNPAIADPELGLDYSRLVHGTQEFSYRRPIIAGDELATVATIEEIRTRAGHDFLTVQAQARADGELVVTTRSIVIIRGPEGQS